VENGGKRKSMPQPENELPFLGLPACRIATTLVLHNSVSTEIKI
jgi:hypothetical protein